MPVALGDTVKGPSTNTAILLILKISRSYIFFYKIFMISLLSPHVAKVAHCRLRVENALVSNSVELAWK